MDSSITIRKAAVEDLPFIMPLFEHARQYMEKTGNPHQWIDGYPQESLIEKEIKDGHCFVCLNKQNKIACTFCLIIGKDPTYTVIEDGQWLNDSTYGTIHRLASDGTVRRIADICIDWCSKIIPNIRVDTHEDNKIMQNVLKRNGFKRCGIIYTHNGTPRIAFQLTKEY